MKESYSYEVLQEIPFEIDFKELYETVRQRISVNSYKNVLNEIKVCVHHYITLECFPQFIGYYGYLYNKIVDDFIFCLKCWEADVMNEINAWKELNKNRSKEDFLDEQQMLNIPISFITEITNNYF